MGPDIGEAIAAVKAQGNGPAGPLFAHHLKMTPEAFDFAICVPVSAPVRAVGRVKPGQRPAVKVVRTVYHGPYEGLVPVPTRICTSSTASPPAVTVAPDAPAGPTPSRRATLGR